MFLVRAKRAQLLGDHDLTAKEEQEERDPE